MKCLNPQNATSVKFHKEYPNLDKLFYHLPCATNNDDPALMIAINEEWSQIIQYDLPETFLKEKDADVFWIQLRKLTDIHGNLLFKHVSDFAVDTLCLPNSNAPSERAWSENKIKIGRLRSAMCFETIRGSMLTSQYVKDVGEIRNFEHTHEMFELMILSLHDEIKDFVYLGDRSVYKTQLTKEVVDRCHEDEKEYENITKKLKVSYESDYIPSEGSSDDDLDFELDTAQNIYDNEIPEISIENIPGSMESVWESNLNNVSNHLCNKSTVTSTNKRNPQFSLKKHLNTSINKVHNALPLIHVEYPNLMTNGLLSNKEYYFTRVTEIVENVVRDIRFYVAVYRRNSFQTYYLAWDEFNTLAPQRWLDGETIDIASMCNERHFINSTCITTRETHALFMDERKDKPGNNWSMYHRNLPNQGYILMPYNYNKNHWMLLMIDVTQKIITLIDPYNKPEKDHQPEVMRLTKHLERFFSECRERDVHRHLPSSQFKFMRFTCNSRPFQPRSNSVDCGLYVVYYIDVIGRNIPFSSNFNPAQLRMELYSKILQNSEPIHNRCLFCCRELTDDDTLTCNLCQRAMHIRCEDNKYDLEKGICVICKSYFKDL